MSDKLELDFSKSGVREASREALPALVAGGVMGNAKAADVACQIIGDIITDAFQPSLDALNHLAQLNRQQVTK